MGNYLKMDDLIKYEGDYESHTINGKTYKIKRLSAMKRNPEFKDFPSKNKLITSNPEQKSILVIQKKKRKKTIKFKKGRIKKTSYGFNGDITKW